MEHEQIDVPPGFESGPGGNPRQDIEELFPEVCNKVSALSCSGQESGKEVVLPCIAKTRAFQKVAQLAPKESARLVQKVAQLVPEFFGLSTADVLELWKHVEQFKLASNLKHEERGTPYHTLSEATDADREDEQEIDWDLRTVQGLKLAASKSDMPGATFVFVDNSNTWAEGKKALAESSGLESKEDCRFRLDGNMMLDVFGSGNERVIQHAALYGSYTQSDEAQYDGGWKQLESTGFQVVRYARSTWSHKEKQVDSQMVADITALACEIDALGNAENCTFMVASGDGDLLPAIERALQRGIKVEIWSWLRATSNKLRRLQDDGRAKFNPLDNHLKEIGFVDEVWNTKRWRVADFHDSCVSVRGVDPCDIPDICRKSLKCEWWYSVMEESDTEDVAIIIRPSTVNRETWLEFLTKETFTDKPDAEVFTYAEYMDKIAPKTKVDQVITRVPSSSNRFQLLGNDESDSDDESDGSSTTAESATTADTALLASPDEDEWEATPRDSATRKPLTSKPDCRHGYRCTRGIACGFAHTADQKAFFEKHGGACPRGYKLKLCSHAPSGRCRFMQTSEWCPYAHGEGDAWCVSCQSSGHSSSKCTGQMKSKHY
jgi:hypothetical protein